MSDDKIHGVSADWAKRAYVDEAKYKEMYAASISDPAKFWGEHGKRVYDSIMENASSKVVFRALTSRVTSHWPLPTGRADARVALSSQ